MPNPTPEPFADWFEQHVLQVQLLLEQPYTTRNMQIWKCLFWSNDGPVTLRLVRSQPIDSPTMINLYLTARYTVLTYPVAQSDLDVRELVAWSGLEKIDPESVNWEREKDSASGIQVVRGGLPNLRMDGNPGGGFKR